MTIALTTCARCKQSFQPKRRSQRTCSAACKKALSRSEKRDTAPSVPPNGRNAPDGHTGQVSEGCVRLWPGLKPLSDLECRVMRVIPTGQCDQRGALLYLPMNEIGPAATGIAPDRGSLERSSK